MSVIDTKWLRGGVYDDEGRPVTDPELFWMRMSVQTGGREIWNGTEWVSREDTMSSTHALYPFSDGDKAVCLVRLSGKPGRLAATVPEELSCDSCYLRTLRSWQTIDPNISVDPHEWPGWPWDHKDWWVQE